MTAPDWCAVRALFDAAASLAAQAQRQVLPAPLRPLLRQTQANTCR
jgi:hypothetical protein